MGLIFEFDSLVAGQWWCPLVDDSCGYDFNIYTTN